MPEVMNPIISTKSVISGGTNYKLNQAGVPILTKVLKKDAKLNLTDGATTTENMLGVNSVKGLNEAISSHIHPTGR